MKRREVEGECTTTNRTVKGMEKKDQRYRYGTTTVLTNAAGLIPPTMRPTIKAGLMLAMGRCRWFVKLVLSAFVNHLCGGTGWLREATDLSSERILIKWIFAVLALRK